MDFGVYLQHHRKRIAIAAIALTVALLLAVSDSTFGLIERALEIARQLIVQHPIWGIVAFVIFSALSAMLAFVSSAVLVPVGINVWGELNTMALLWSGWLIGGAAAYSIGRFLGRSIVRLLVSKEQMERYEGSISERVGWPAVFFFQLALPSEVPGYLLGIVRYPFLLYLSALALAELPFAAGAVYLGRSFLDRNYVMMLGFGVAGIFLMVVAVAAWHHRQSRSD